jgi:hypothetical protein
MVADRWGIFFAYGTVGILLLTAVALIFVANAVAKTHAAETLARAVSAEA